jgi:HK97 family phage major capsid protein
MNPIATLRQKRGATQDQKDLALAKMTDNVECKTAEQKAAYDAAEADAGNLDAQIKRIDAQIARLEEAEAAKAASAQPIGHVDVSAAGSDDPKREKGDRFARFVRAVAVGRGDNVKAAQFAEQVLHDGEVAKALGTSDFASGAALVPTSFSSEFIELLRPASVVRRMGARTQPIPNGNDTIPKMTGGASAYYLGDNQPIAKTEQTVGQITMSEKHLACLVPVSNNLIRVANASVDTMIRQDLVAAVAQKEDETFLRSDGTGSRPRGLKYWVDPANILSVNTTVNLANVGKDLGRLWLALQEGYCRMINPGWLMAPRTYNYLMELRDGNGNKAYPEMDRGVLKGYPIAFTTQIPTNLAVTDTAESEIYFLDFADVVIGDNGIEVTAQDGAVYEDGGTVYSGFSRNQTVIRIIAHHDMVVRHAKSLAMFKDVDWQ